MTKNLSEILSIRNSNVALYERYLRFYENALCVNRRLTFEFAKKYKKWSNYDFIRKYELTKNIVTTYNGFLNKLKINKPIVSSYNNMSKTKLDKVGTYASYVADNNKEEINQWSSEKNLCGVSYVQTFIKNIKEYNTTIDYKTGKKKRTLLNTYKEPTLMYIGVFDTIIDISGNNRYIGSIKRFTNKQIEELYPDFISSKVQESPKYTIMQNFNRVKKVDIMDIACSNIGAKSKLYDVYEQLATEGIHEVIDWFEYGKDGFLKQAVIINGEEIYNGDTLYPFEEFPITPCYYSKIPGSVMAEGIGSMTIETQSEIDHLYTGYKLGLKTFVYPDWSAMGGADNDAVVHEGLTVKRRSGGNNGGVEQIKYYDPNLLTMVRNEILTLEQKVINNFLLNNINNGGANARVSGEINERRSARENKISEVIDNMGIAMAKIMKQFIKIKQEGFGMIKISGKDINFIELDLGFDITFDGEEILKLKETMISDLINKIGILQPYNINPNTGEQYITNRDIFSLASNYLGVDEIIPTNDERLKRIDEDIAYSKSKSEKMPQAPMDKVDKVTMNVSASVDKLPPEYQAALLNIVVPGINQNPEESIQPQADTLPVETNTTTQQNEVDPRIQAMQEYQDNQSPL